MARVIHIVSFSLAWLCGTALICGIVREAKSQDIFDGYISTFSGWTIIFAVISYKTRPSRSNNRPAEVPDEMLLKHVKVVCDDAGKRRAVIFQRRDGSFGFYEEVWEENPYGSGWTIRFPASECHCDSLEIAERETKARIPWLAGGDGETRVE